METIGYLIENYEERVYQINEASPVDALKFLMQEHGLKQSDLKEIGSQGVVSGILAGKRSLNLEQIKKSVIGFMFHHWCLYKLNGVGSQNCITNNSKRVDWSVIIDFL